MKREELKEQLESTLEKFNPSKNSKAFTPREKLNHLRGLLGHVIGIEKEKQLFHAVKTVAYFDPDLDQDFLWDAMFFFNVGATLYEELIRRGKASLSVEV